MNYTVISDKDNKERRNLVINELNKIGGVLKLHLQMQLWPPKCRMR